MTYAKAKGPQTWKQYSNYCLGISLGSKSFEGDRLKAIVDWLNQSSFQSGIVDFSNTLHRYNYMVEDGLSETEARKKILEESDRWLNKHYPILSELKAPHTMISWDRWLTHEKFPSYKEQFDNAFKDDALFQQAVLGDVESYLLRRFNSTLQETDQETIDLSVAFLIEELAAHSILYEDYPCAVIYPGKQQESFKSVREGRIKNVPAGLQRSFHTRLVLHDFSIVSADNPIEEAHEIKKYS